jgi:uncharacterized membrane protein YozB (DUF420 family)
MKESLDNPKELSSITETTKPIHQKLAIIGLTVFFAGPIVMIISGFLPSILPDRQAIYMFGGALGWIAFVLPAIGCIISIISVVMCKKSKVPMHGSAIGVIVMCNPIFYYIYFIMCGLTGYGLAGLAMM